MSQAQPKELNADIVILGAGSSGLAAALTVALAGKNVIVLEKNRKPGGRADYAEGVFGVETQMQRSGWMNVTRDETFTADMAETRWEANVPLVRRFQNQSADTIDWLVAQGVEFEGPQRIDWTSQPTWHIVKGHGKALAHTLYERLQEHINVTVLFNTPGTGLIVENGCVVGAKAVTVEGGELEVRAKGGVIVSTGGFSNNLDMLREYAHVDNPVQMANIGCTGDGINMTKAVGAQFDSMSPVMLVNAIDVHLPKMSYDHMMIGQIGSQPRNIWVDRAGKRFCSEEVAFDFIFAGNALHRIKVAWAIFDERLKKYYMEMGLDTGVGVVIPAMTKVRNFDQLWTTAIAEPEGAVVAATSLQELATLTGLPEVVLNETLLKYNNDAEHNLDEAFAKSRRWLQPLDLSGPLYAVRMSYGILTTLGGIKVDEKLRPLDENEVPIEGIYLTGNDAGGLTAADSYTLGAASGTTFGFAVGSGRMAAAAALERLADCP